jgi:hypothetical protein
LCFISPTWSESLVNSSCESCIYFSSMKNIFQLSLNSSLIRMTFSFTTFKMFTILSLPFNYSSISCTLSSYSIIADLSNLERLTFSWCSIFNVSIPFKCVSFTFSMSTLCSLTHPCWSYQFFLGFYQLNSTV